MIALDWGLSSFRAWRLDAAGMVRETRSAPAGILALAEAGTGFAAALDAQLGDWLAAPDAGPVLACGMIGSRQGWVEAPYAPCPAGLADLAAAFATADTPHGPVRFVPGVQAGAPDSADAAIDVMRGEESQIVGALAATGRADAVLCLPGTHSKWALAEDGRIADFRTYMTGELFAVLRRHSILGRLMPAEGDAAANAVDPAEDAAAFARGLDRAATPGGLPSHLFSTRTAGLFGQVAPAALPAYLSGLLIGAELQGAVATLGDRLRAAPVLLVGSPALCARYATALDRLGVATATLPEDVAARGLHAIAGAAGLLG